MKKGFLINIVLIFVYINTFAQSDSTDEYTKPSNELELANTLQNPIAHLINLQYQNNFEFKVGSQDGFRYVLNIQPLIPFHLGNRWSIITRTIIPVVAQIGRAEPTGRTGIADIVLNTYISPKNIPFVLGIGPSIQFPVATSSVFGTRRFAIGPTIALLKQFGSFRIAAIPHHLLAGAKSENEKSINITVVRAYITYINKSLTTFGIFSEDVGDWNSGTWSISVTPTIGQLTKLVNQYVDLSIGIKYYIAPPTQAPQWGIRFTIVEVIPTKALKKMMDN